MQTYTSNLKKRRKAIKKHYKAKIKNAKGFVRFCYGLTILFRVLAVVLGAANLVYCAVWSRFPVIDLLFLVLTVFLPYALSYIPNAVCTTAVTSEYSLRLRETICLMENGFSYSYQDLFSNVIFGFDVLYSNIQKLEYDEKCRILTIYGTIDSGIYDNGKRLNTEQCSQLSFLNIYDDDIHALLKSKH